MPELTPFEQKLAAAKARRGDTAPPPPEHPPEVIPDIEERPENPLRDAIKSHVGIYEAYCRYTGRPAPAKTTGQVKIYCPNPGHGGDGDGTAGAKSMTASMSIEKGVWTCHYVCVNPRTGGDLGGDVFDLAAYHYGWDVQADFAKLCQQIADDFGLAVVKSPAGKKKVVEAVPSDPLPRPVILPTAKDHPEDQPPTAPRVDWEELVPAHTFLHKAMREFTRDDDLPHEFYFWPLLQVVAAAAGTHCILPERQPVLGKLYLCYLEETSSGKTRALELCQELLRQSLPWDKDNCTGVLNLATPASGPAIFKLFCKTTGTPAEPAAINGYLKLPELSMFVAKSNASTDTSKETLMSLFDHTYGTIKSYGITAGELEALDPYCQVISTTQSSAVHMFLKKSDTFTGFFNRWIIVKGESRVEHLNEVTPPLPPLSTLIKLVKDLSAWCKATPSGVREIQWTDDGRAAWKSFFRATLEPMKRDPDADPMLRRLDLMLKKLMLLFCINEKIEWVTEDVVERVLELYPYLHLTYTMFSGDVNTDDAVKCQSRILKILERFEAAGTFPTKRDLVKSIGSAFKTETIVKQLQILEAGGILFWNEDKKEGRGRPTFRATTKEPASEMRATTT